MTIELASETRVAMDKIVAGASSKSEKIRALGRAQFRRADIARYLNIRYQFVRNVLEQTEREGKDEPGEPGAAPPHQEWAQVGPDGRIVIPVSYRRLLGIEAGDHVLMLLDNGEVRLVGRNAAVRRAQELVARYVPEKSGMADELIAERRVEAARENRK